MINSVEKLKESIDRKHRQENNVQTRNESNKVQNRKETSQKQQHSQRKSR